MMFAASSHSRQFDKQGFVVIKGVLEIAEIQALACFYRSLAPVDLPFYTTNWIPDSAYKENIHHRLKPMLDKAMARHLSGFRSVFSYFLVKNPHLTRKVAIHQDWSLADERLFSGLTAWIPLTDTNEQNGRFHVFPCSHHLFGNIRGTNIEMPYSHIGDILEKKVMQPVDLKAGDAILFDHRLVHFSPPNVSDCPRVAVGHTLLPSEAPMYHYYKKASEDSQIYRQQVPDDFLLRYSFKEPLDSYFTNQPEPVAWREYQLTYPKFVMKYCAGKMFGRI